MKKLTGKKEEEKLEYELTDEFFRWQYMYEHGGSDPFYEDGYNMNLLRNHIIYFKKRLEEISYFPEIYFKETPPEMPNKYMARPKEIKRNARKSLEMYESDANYQALVEARPKIDAKTATDTNIDNVIRYVTGLRAAIEHDSLVVMRRHENPDIYLDSFKTCRSRLGKILPTPEKKGQLTIFDFLGT